MNVLLTSAELRRLSHILERERQENPTAVFRIWETTIGRYDDARILLRIGLDDPQEDDERTSCKDIPFVASRDFLDLRGKPHIFYIFTGEDGRPEVMEAGI